MSKTPTQFRLNDGDIERLDELVETASGIADSNGIGRITRATVVRALLFIGLETSEKTFLEAIKNAKITG